MRDPNLSPSTKTNLKWISDLNARPKTLKLIEESIWKTLENTVLSNTFLNRTLLAQEVRACINKRNCIRLKLLHSKGSNY
jgi:hypothetical protein